MKKKKTKIDKDNSGKKTIWKNTVAINNILKKKL